MTNHDKLLIQVDTKVTQLCKSLTSYEKNNRQDHQTIFDLLDKNIDRIDKRLIHDDDKSIECKDSLIDRIHKKISWTHFAWIVGGLTGLFFAIILIIGATILDIDHKINELLIVNDIPVSKIITDQPQENTN